LKPIRLLSLLERNQYSLSIYGIYIAPLQGNYSEVLAAQARAKRRERFLELAPSKVTPGYSYKLY